MDYQVLLKSLVAMITEVCDACETPCKAKSCLESGDLPELDDACDCIKMALAQAKSMDVDLRNRGAA